MHPPLFQHHPLCKEEVNALVTCHEENPVAKFFNACGQAKRNLDMCFKEEKRLRKKLNPKFEGRSPSMGGSADAAVSQPAASTGSS